MTAKVLHLRKIQPGDLIDTVRVLRRYMNVADTSANTIYADFSTIDNDVNENAEKARRHIEATAARLRALIASIEKTPMYIAARRKKLDAESDDVVVYDTLMSDDDSKEDDEV